MERPDIFYYLDYRTWLKDMLEYLRKTKDKSIRRVSLEADFGSSSFLSMIISGKRHLGAEGIKKLDKVFELTTQERSYLLKLIAFASAKDLDQKDQCYRVLLSELKKRKIRTLKNPEYEFFSNWYFVAVLEALSTPWATLSPKAQALALGISSEDLQSAYKQLESLGLIEKKDHEWKRTDESLLTDSETQSILVRNFHRQMIERSLKSLQELGPEKRFNAALTLPVNKKDLAEIRRKIEKLQKEIHLEFSDAKDPDQVVQFNLQLFPLLPEVE